MSVTYTKEELVALATTHTDIEVRKAAAESLYTAGMKAGGLEIVAAGQRALGIPVSAPQVPS